MRSDADSTRPISVPPSLNISTKAFLNNLIGLMLEYVLSQISATATTLHKGSSAPFTVAALCAGPHPQLVIFMSVCAAVDGVPQ